MATNNQSSQENTVPADGRETIRQQIEAVRKNNPDTLAASGEPTDNSVSWGKAKRGSISVYESKIIYTEKTRFTI